MTSFTVLIRADASSTIGTGHVMRCLVLAEALKENGFEPVFLTKPLEGNIDHKIAENGFRLVSLVSDDAGAEIEEVCDAIRVTGAAMIVFDHYGIDAGYEKRVKDATGIRVMVFDDMYKPHHCDILLNQNMYADAARYDALVPPGCKRLCGVEYALLRKEFRTITKRDRSKAPEGRLNLLVTLGGADPGNVTLKVMEALEKVEGVTFNVTVVVGAVNPHLGAIRAFPSSSGCVFDIVVNASNMAELMNEADVAISAAGSTTIELLYMQVPMMLIVLADNQDAVAREMQRQGFGINLGTAKALHVETLTVQIADYLHARIGREGKGGQPALPSIGNIEKVVKKMVCGMYADYALREAAAEDMMAVFSLSNDAEVRKYSMNTAPIPLEDHRRWFEKRLSDTQSPFLVVAQGDTCLGQVRLDKKAEGYVFSISLSRALRGCGFAADIIGKSLQRLPEGSLAVAYIRHDNAASVKSFESNGFIPVEPVSNHSEFLTLTRRV
jgi:UDP-2,4-diacetamido-2,4,6-trideoxy-beta-L-altropyranose hydrolase